MKTRVHSLAAALVVLVIPFLFGSCANQKKKGEKESEVAATEANTRPRGPWNQVDESNLPTSVGTRDSYSRVNTSMPFVALTFDDGPHASNTPRLLDILKSRNVKATFYVVATNARRYPEIMRRIVAEGHEIGNHTVTHGNLTKMSESEVRKELSLSHEAIVATTGIAPRTMRPPYGAITSSQKSWIRKEFGYPSILWSVDPEDWKRPGASVVANRLVSGARPGGILLVHDIYSPSIDAMPLTIDQLLSKGFQFVTITQLIAMDGKG